MQLKHDEPTGSPATAQPAVEPIANIKTLATTAPLAQIDGPTYATAQLLVQQVAYTLSDKVFSYSPETFDLDVAARAWAAAQEPNAHGYATTVVPLQTRAGAGAFALGYLFSEDFDARKRDVPQTLVAPTASLRLLRASLDQLALLYGAASPFVAHVAAVDYRSSGGLDSGRLVSDYGAALQTADELGLALVVSTTAAEAQHMALFATLAAHVQPTLHVYDGVRTARETVRVTDALSAAHVGEAYGALAQRVAAAASAASPATATNAGKILALLQAFNNELGTAYQPFEYHGHDAAETVVVVFGSVEAQLAAQAVAPLAAAGHRVGAVHVRLYRPFVEEAFLAVLPPTVRRIAVLGQVASEAAVAEPAVASALYTDVLAAVALSPATRWAQAAAPAVADVKYAAATVPTPAFVASVLATSHHGAGAAELPALAHTLAHDAVRQYTFWNTDDAVARAAPAAVATALAQQPGAHVATHDMYDNLVQGGVVRTDLRVAVPTAATKAAALHAPFAVEAADVVVVGNEALLKTVDVLAGAAPTGATLLLCLPGFKTADAEKRIPAPLRQAVQQRKVLLYALDTAEPTDAAAATPETAGVSVKMLVEQAFLHVAHPALPGADVARLSAALYEGPQTEAVVAATALATAEALTERLTAVEVPAAWAEVSADAAPAPTPATVAATSFAAFDKTETEPAVRVGDWQEAARGLVFKEAYGTRTALRPDLPVKTATVTVTENRRLTPADYERHIFHIEFDLGTSGVRYEIGEALGVHAENDAAAVDEFLAWYGLDGDALVQAPSREDAAVLETRTLTQALRQNVDLLGKPPKRFYEALAAFATDAGEQATLAGLGGAAGAAGFQKRSETDTVTYADVLAEFPSARPGAADLVRIVAPLKRREYSIASAQAVTPTAVALMIVVVDWVDGRGRKRYGQASRYLSQLAPGAQVTVSVKPSVMKLPAKAETPLVMAGLGTGLAPFRAFVQYRAMQKARGERIGAILLFLGSRHQREEYLYGEEWEAYVDAGVITLLGAAFSRDQPEKIYIQDRMRQSMDAVVQSYIRDEGAFYLCGPTWPVPDLTDVLKEAIATDARAHGRKVDPHKEIDRLKENGRYVLEVY